MAGRGRKRRPGEAKERSASRDLLLDADGMPTTPNGREIARHVLVAVRRSPAMRAYRGKLVEDARISTGGRFETGVVDAIVGDLVASGRLVEDGSGFLKTGRTKAFSDLTDAGKTVIEAMGLLSAARLFPESDKRTVADAFVSVRRLSGLHRHGEGSDRVVLVAERVRVVPGGAESSSVLVVTSERRGVVLRRVDGSAVSMRAGPEGAIGIDVDHEAVRRARRLRADFSKMPVFILGSASGWYEPPTQIAGAWRSACRVERPDLEAVLGRPATDGEWNSFSRAVRRVDVRHKETILQRMVASILDPEARKAAMRVPGSRIALYEWYLGSDEKAGIWRRQASAAWPVFSGLMPKVEATIDAGDPLSPAMCALLGIGPKRLAEFRGLGWKRTSIHVQKELSSDERSSLHLGLRLLPDHVALPTVAEGSYPGEMSNWTPNGTLVKGPGAAWYRPLEVVGGWSQGRLGDLPHASISAMMARDMPKTVEFCMSRNGADALRFVARHLDSIVGNAVDRAYASSVSARLLLSAVLGPSGSFKAWRRFDETFHRRQRAVSAAWHAPVEGPDVVVEAVGWSPGPQVWKHEAGEIRWLLRRAEVVAEGETMQHCVGSYWWDVRNGGCCIGSIEGRDGSRATVELCLSLPVREDGHERVLSMNQLFGSRNMPPSLRCTEVAAAFLDALSSRRLEPDWDAYGRIMEANRSMVDEDAGEDGIARVDPAKALEIVRPLLPLSLSGFSVSDLVAAYEDERLRMVELGADPEETVSGAWKGEPRPGDGWEDAIPFGDGWGFGFDDAPRAGPEPWDEEPGF